MSPSLVEIGNRVAGVSEIYASRSSIRRHDNRYALNGVEGGEPVAEHKSIDIEAALERKWFGHLAGAQP